MKLDPNAVMTEPQLAILRDAYGKRERIPSACADELCSLVRKAGNDLLRQLFAAKIKFVSAIALNEMTRRNLSA